MRKSPSNEELARSMMSPSQTPSLELAQRTLAAPPTPLTPLTPSLQLAQDAVATTASPPIPTASAHSVGNENSSNSNASLTSQRSNLERDGDDPLRLLGLRLRFVLLMIRAQLAAVGQRWHMPLKQQARRFPRRRRGEKA
ncbi:hypothetical protein F441_20566 [Phytophthora nicotianae CJ01A1]|uniref:Uncharacterized protein n=4 Tax=Phytophthora nicotianae TaxID=4792 RepID=V9E0Q1_PHYNI|nr:hypothetical protein F443_20697 [Phytophthora nicotianae P1569]ETO61233.1 hypothetical protein F444_20713 [Phytophthora nicotianae P1976]ETP02351.1 hypothetical protein F441_20566 [Phytophthora nicotianae CJ01A1]ETP30533.1 hypothetical protein F442_20495 [Phytophthora nicotianae P10297]